MIPHRGHMPTMRCNHYLSQGNGEYLENDPNSYLKKKVLSLESVKKVKVQGFFFFFFKAKNLKIMTTSKTGFRSWSKLEDSNTINLYTNKQTMQNKKRSRTKHWILLGAFSIQGTLHGSCCGQLSENRGQTASIGRLHEETIFYLQSLFFPIPSTFYEKTIFFRFIFFLTFETSAFCGFITNRTLSFHFSIIKVNNSPASRSRERALFLLIRRLSKAFLFFVNLETNKSRWDNITEKETNHLSRIILNK